MATKVKLTNTTAADLRAGLGKAPTIYWDEDLPGFGVRVSPQGKAVYFAQYRDRVGRQAKTTIGAVTALKADKARDEAKNLLARVQLGGNPQKDLREARQAERVVDLVDAYLAKVETSLRPRSYEEAERALRKRAKPLHHEKADRVTRRDIASLIEKVSEESGPFAANKVRANLSALWSWALKAGRVQNGNPVAYTDKPVRNVSRDRVLTDGELKLIWRCTHTGHDYDRIVRLLMLSAARRDEVGALPWDELSDAGPLGVRMWTLAAERSKNHRPHEVALGPLAAAQLPGSRGNFPVIFGRKSADMRGFSGYSKCKARLDARMLAALVKDFTEANGRPPADGEVKLAPWRLHDLRRTFSTWGNESGIEPHVVEAVLNHVSGAAKAGVAGVYNRAQYRAQKLVALGAWEQHIRRLSEAG